VENLDHEAWKGIMSSGECDLTKRVVSEVRPGHADLSGCIKYGFTDARNVLERASARETTVRVAVGAIAKAFLREIGVEIGSHVYNIGGVTSEKGCYSASELIKESDLSEVRCMDETASEKMKVDAAKIYQILFLLRLRKMVERPIVRIITPYTPTATDSSMEGECIRINVKYPSRGNEYAIAPTTPLREILQRGTRSQI
jgi:hypothetical protein